VSVGFGAQETQPDDVLHALRILTAHFFQNREGAPTPAAVEDLLINHRLFSA